MHTQNTIAVSQLELTLFSAVGDGMHVEASPSRSAVAQPGPLFTFREDEIHGKQVVVHLPDRDLVIPLSELKRAIALAEIEVRKESSYD